VRRAEGMRKLLAASVIAILCMATVALLPQQSSADPYEAVATMDPLSQPRASAVVETGFDGNVYAIGGKAVDVMMADPAYLDSVLIYDTGTGATSRGHSMPFGVSGAAGAVGHDGKIYVFGGYNASGYVTYTQIYDPLTDIWAMGDSAPIRMHTAKAVVGDDGRFYVFGTEIQPNSTLIYDPVGDSWVFGQDVPTPRNGPAVVAYNGTAIFVIGGSSGGNGLGIVEVYNPIADTWSSAGSLNMPRAYAEAEVGRNGYIYCHGGVDGFLLDSAPQLSSIEMYDPDFDSWSNLWVSLPTAVSCHGSTVDKTGNILAVGGYSSGVVIPDIQVIVAMDIEFDELKIVSPHDGSTVNGVVTINADLKNPSVGANAIEIWIDGVLVDEQLGAWNVNSWTYNWDTSGLGEGSSHSIVVKAFLWDMRIVQDSIDVMVTEISTEQKIQQIQENLTAIIADLTNIQTTLTGIVDSLSAISEDLMDIDANLTSVSSDLAALSADLMDLQSSLDMLSAIVDENFTMLGGNISAIKSSVTSLISDIQDLQDALEDMDDSVAEDLAGLATQLDAIGDALSDLNEALTGIDDTTTNTQDTSDSASMYAMIAMFLAVIVAALVAINILMSMRKR